MGYSIPTHSSQIQGGPRGICSGSFTFQTFGCPECPNQGGTCLRSSAIALLDQTLHALHMNLGFGPLGVQNVEDVIFRADEGHDEILRDKVFF